MDQSVRLQRLCVSEEGDLGYLLYITKESNEFQFIPKDFKKY
jgi:hypothetical protein